MKFFSARSLLRAAAASILLSAALSAHAAGTFTLSLNFDSSVSASDQTTFLDAAVTWQSLIRSFQGTITGGPLTISVSTPAIDGAGGILGQAGPTYGNTYGSTFLYATAGAMQFDSADLSMLRTTGMLSAVILHEIGHVIGFGTLWTQNNLYNSATGLFTGTNATLAYRAEFNQPLALGVPVEQGGGSGTAGGHWNEVDGGGVDTGIVDSQGRDFRYDLMTGWLDSPTFISTTTVQSFADLGYVVVPEPGTWVPLGVGAFFLRAVMVRRRSCASV